MITPTKCGIKLYIFEPEHDTQELSASQFYFNEENKASEEKYSSRLNKKIKEPHMALITKALL